MQEAREEFFGDLQDKTAALEIDITQYNMNEKSPNITYKPNSTRIPKLLILIILLWQVDIYI